MATSEADISPQDTQHPSGNELFDSVANVGLHDEANQPDLRESKKVTTPSRPLMIYTRPQILLLHNSPLVRPPPDMPELKDWFGSENEQSLNKKEPEPSTPSSARERRFRRDPEDGETPARPTFRSTLSQPSQMGNFKHQSLRASDRDRERDRDRDGDKDRERDIRDKEGQERLRNLSDKYDRDRLALPSLRSKERDAAPHLAASSSSRLGTQTQVATVTSRRADTREAAKKKAGESSEDWRRGAEPPRSAREDRSETGRKDRDDRERPRSRVRDASRTRREPSTSRRERDRDRDDRERDRERRGDRDREDYRRERDEYRRDRERDPDRDLEPDDPRRWRDDGKRDERMAARRGDRHPDRERVRDRDPGWDPSHDRRWTAADDRGDGRPKRGSARDKRSGAVVDEGKDRDERRDREREREKEPAWMDTYIPTSSSAGILGGQGGDGELDGIQAWKKGMKEKEQKDKIPPNSKENAEGDRPEASEVPGKQLDEIQLFRLMMKREEEKKKTDRPDTPQGDLHTPASPAIDTGVSGTMRTREQQKVSSSIGDDKAVTSSQTVDGEPRREDETPRSALAPPTPVSNHDAAPATAPGGPRSLLSILAQSSPKDSTNTTHPPPPLDLSLDKTKASSSRLFPNPISQENSPSIKTPSEPASTISAQFNPPPGSRLLAFGARAPSAGPTSLAKPQVPTSQSPASQVTNGLHPSSSSDFQSIQQNTFPSGMSRPSEVPSNQGSSKHEPHRAQPGFSPFEEQSRTPYGFDEPREQGNLPHGTGSLRRVSADRSPFPPTSEPGPYADTGPSFDTSNSPGYAAGKGSRFAKFFDGKAREGAPPIAKAQTPVGFISSSPVPSQKQEQGNFNGLLGGNTGHRAMDDIFAMLNSSAQQGQRVNPISPPMSAPSSGSVPFGQQAHNNLQLLQQQQLHHHQPQHPHPNGRLESLYESRLDDRNFMPDGMVPGLRSAPPPRSREGSGMFPDSLEDQMHFNGQRLPPQQRGLDQMYSGPIPSMYAQHAGRNSGLPIQQPHYRGGPSPISGQNSLQNPQQRLPPGLANLGGRPPHEPSQFINMPGMPSAALHGTLHGNGPPQQVFNNFAAGGNLGYGGGPQMRAPPGPHQLQNPLAHNPMAGLGHPNNMDIRVPNQAQLLGMGGVGNGLRGVGGGGFGPPQGPAAQMQPPLLAMRQQQQQQQQQPHLLPHMMPHLLPPHLQQQGLPGPNNQPAHDLMALLMGGPHRE